MKMFIHSAYGVLECKPMTLQAIEDSISEKPFVINEDENPIEPVNEDKVKED